MSSSNPDQEHPDKSEPNIERQSELRTAYDQNRLQAKPPYAHVRIGTWGELMWIIHEQGWSVDPTATNVERPNLSYANLEGINLRGINLYQSDFSFANLHAARLSRSYLIEVQFKNANLTETDLEGADLSRAVLLRADLRRANLIDMHSYRANLDLAKLEGATRGHAPPNDNEPDDARQGELEDAYQMNISAGRAAYWGVVIRTRGELKWIMGKRSWAGAHDILGKVPANFSGADLRYTNLKGIQLGRADLSQSMLFRTNLEGAYLQRTDLRGTTLREADLSGCILAGSLMDTTTILVGIIVDAHTRFADVIWNGASLAQVEWAHVRILGDEPTFIKAGQSRKERVRALNDTVRAYRGLAVELSRQGITRAASNYRLRQQRLERKALFRQGAFGLWLVSLILDLLAGYGERLRYTLTAYAIVIGVCTGLYFVIAQTNSQVMKIEAGKCWASILYDSLLLSINAFHGRGFFPSSLGYGGPFSGIAAIEAVLGLIIEVAFIATTTRRFLSGS